MNKLSPAFLLAAVFGVSSLLAQPTAPVTATPATAAPAMAAPVDPIPVRAVPGSGGASPHETVSARIGAGRGGQLVTITYGRPFGKGRKIWGALVPWNAVWRMGSDEATTLITQAPLVIGGVDVPAGAYTLCMFPVEDGTTKLIINKQIGQWGIPYTPAIQANELARVDMVKDTISTAVEEFTISVTNKSGATPPAGTIRAQWETTQYSVAFTVKK